MCMFLGLWENIGNLCFVFYYCRSILLYTSKLYCITDSCPKHFLIFNVSVQLQTEKKILLSYQVESQMTSNILVIYGHIEISR